MTKTFKDYRAAIRKELAKLDADKLEKSKNSIFEKSVAEPATIHVPPVEELILDQSNVVDQDLLKENLLLALMEAASLEFTTIPPYLTALWSIKDQDEPIADSIRTIIHEEMLHMALVNNLIVALGGAPRTTREYVPVYPTKLPAELHPELSVSLQGLDEQGLEIFLEIERPKTVVPIEGEPDPVFPAEDKTIGEFYEEEVRKAAICLNPTFKTEKQIAGPLAPKVISDLASMNDAIQIILDQGEGSHGIPYDSHPEDLAHYYRFRAIQLKRKLLWDPEAKVLRKTEEYPSVATYLTAPPPPNGYGSDYPEEIQTLSNQFNIEYSRMLNFLEEAWGDGGHASLLRAIECMFNLRPIARKMIEIPNKDGLGHAPEFRYLRDPGAEKAKPAQASATSSSSRRNSS